jgi:hypothetical protein
MRPSCPCHACAPADLRAACIVTRISWAEPPDRVTRFVVGREWGVLESTSLMLRQGLEYGRSHIRLIVRSAMSGLPYDRTTGRFEATERLIELAERAAAFAPPAERAEKDLDPRIVIACVVSLFLGWAATESWVRPAAGLGDMDDAELLDGIERVILGILREDVPGLGRDQQLSP